MSNFVLKKNTNNNIVATVSERSQLIDPYYLIVFKSKFSTSDVYTKTIVVDSVESNIRYNLFSIQEKESPDPFQGEVYFPETGEWSYEIYESNIQTLDVADTTGRILQRGLLIVEEDGVV